MWPPAPPSRRAPRPRPGARLPHRRADHRSRTGPMAASAPSTPWWLGPPVDGRPPDRSADGTTSTVTGLVAESGGIIVTTRVALAEPGRSRSSSRTAPDRSPSWSGSTRPPDLAVVRIADDLPAATFDADDPTVGRMAVAAALEPASHARRHAGVRSTPARWCRPGRPWRPDSVTTAFAATAVARPALPRRPRLCPARQQWPGVGHARDDHRERDVDHGGLPSRRTGDRRGPPAGHVGDGRARLAGRGEREPTPTTTDVRGNAGDLVQPATAPW